MSETNITNGITNDSARRADDAGASIPCASAPDEAASDANALGEAGADGAAVPRAAVPRATVPRATASRATANGIDVTAHRATANDADAVATFNATATTARSGPTAGKLVFLDIDGTLADERHIVPESAKEACRRAQANGHMLFICTGRSLPKIERGILALGFDGVVSVAGAQANLGERVLFQRFIPAEAIDAATAYFERHGIENYQWQGADGMYISDGYRRYMEAKGSAWNKGEFARFWHPIDRVEIPEGSTLGHVIRASKGSYFSGPDPDVTFEDVQRDLAPWFQVVHASYDKISPNNGELLLNGVDKGTAVRQVAAALGRDVADTIAIGDSDNDTAMLKAAGTSVAMGNAIHGIERFCDMQTTDIHDDGIANAFRRLGLV